MQRFSVLDLFTIGIGPSSSHAVGPMRAAHRFRKELLAHPDRADITAVRAELFGSLALTGIGHGTDKAVLLGLEGETPEEVDPGTVSERAAGIRRAGRLSLAPDLQVAFHDSEHLLLHKRKSLPGHPNGMRFTAYGPDRRERLCRTYYSVGGGYVLSEEELNAPPPTNETPPPHPFESARELIAIADRTGLPVSDIMLANETQERSPGEVRTRLLRVWAEMKRCIERGCHAEGTLPGGLKVARRAPRLYRDLCARGEEVEADPLSILDWVDLAALAVNEENAAGGRVVTAPTNGAAGVIPAVLSYYERFCPNATEDGVVRFLLTAGAIAYLYKRHASLSGAEVGCQGEVGVACSMAAGALAEVLGGSVRQVEQAAEIGMEHNLGLTCDPIGGLVQIPCIERNAMGAVKAINAARLALRSDGTHYVSLDRVIKVMRRTGADMSTKYKETSRGGLAVNVIEC